MAPNAYRIARMVRALAWALVDREHPVLAHLIPVRRCNLACAYCNEYDAVSAPVPLEVLRRRVDLLAGLGTSVITISGGEPLLHPELPALIAYVRGRGRIATLISNGYLLSPEKIAALNAAGLDHLQISIDNVEPDDTSKKSLRLLEPKLRWLADRARFSVNINSVVGSPVRIPEDALVVARRAQELGFARSVGILHDGEGQLAAFSPRVMAVYRELLRGGSRWMMWMNRRFQENLAQGRPNAWRCRAGSRYLYVDEDGLVHYCSQQRGSPAIPLEAYTREMVRREYGARKPCAPYCTINCVQQVALIDNWRDPQTDAARRPRPVPARSPDFIKA